MIGIVLVSHSARLADGLAELLRQVADDGVRIEAAGGGPDGSLGTDGARIAEAASRADDGDGVVLLADIGSAVLSVRALLSDGALDGRRALLADAPLVEGSVAATVAASAGMGLDGVAGAAMEAWDVRKL